MSEGILLSQYSGAILGPIAKLLGIILNAVFSIVPNVGVAIILFTLIIYICLLPLTYKQQKFSKLSAKMNPEIQKVQAKYKGKQDQTSMQRQNEEIQMIYHKYGVSPTGSCLQLIIQMPILFALYRVINSIPAYVKPIYNVLEGLSKNILSTSDGVAVISGLETTKKVFAKYISNNNFTGDSAVESVMDVLNRATSKEWDTIGQISGIDANIFNSARAGFENFNTFLGLNISNTPMYIIKDSFESGKYLLVIGAVLIPVLAAFTQWMNIFFMPQPANQNNADQTASMMKSMNLMMPIMSAFFCLSLPCGMGIYWISGAVIRSIEQVIINKRIDKMDIDSIIDNNIKKYNEKMKGKATKSFVDIKKNTGSSSADKDAAMAKAEEYYKNHSKPGSISAKANMVKQFNEKNKK